MGNNARNDRTPASGGASGDLLIRDNSAIKRFDPHIGQTPDLFSAKEGRLGIVLEILKSPWMRRGSELVGDDDSALGRRRFEPIAVVWSEADRAPALFAWRMREYPVEEVVQSWALERFWWDPRRRVSRRYWRVLARGGTYDLAYDRVEKRWLLLALQD